MSEVSQLRIGELARRTGVATDLLRAWERRYGLLAPTRTESGYRLYSSADVRRVGRMRELLATGVSAAEAAREALAEPPSGRAGRPGGSAGRAGRRDSGGSTTRPRTPRSTGCSPTSRSTPCSTARCCRCCASSEKAGRGARSRSPRSTSPHTSCAAGSSGSRAAGIAAAGRRAVLASPPEERHDLGLLIFGLALREHGWRITFLGGDTPLETLAETVHQLAPGRGRARRHRRGPVRRGRRAAARALRRDDDLARRVRCRFGRRRARPAPSCSTCHRSRRQRSSRPKPV